MSLTITTDVFCDECSQWTEGVTGPRTDAKGARKNARRLLVEVMFCSITHGATVGTAPSPIIRRYAMYSEDEIETSVLLMKNVFGAGMRCRFNGDWQDSNPWPMDSMMYDAWDAGWTQAFVMGRPNNYRRSS